MENGFWIMFAGFAVVWVVVGGYVLSINRRQRDLSREISSLQDRLGQRAE